MAKRTAKEIEKDCKKIREAAKTAKSIKDIERATNLSYAEINTTMSKHPTIFKRIKQQIAVNKEQAQIEKKNEKEALIKTEKKARPKKEKDAKTKIAKKSISSEQNMTEQEVKNYVIDASITGIKSLREDILDKICDTKSKIILTSITIRELENMQKFRDTNGVDARYILALAAENYKNFETVLIDESLEIPDDCIIKYCAENKENVVLLTSNKTMALKARMYGVKVNYLKQDSNHISNKPRFKSNSKIRTLIPAKKVANKLLISGFCTSTMEICVYSDGIKYTEGVRELNIGDDVFIATKKKDYITFAHYKMISLYAENNCELVYSRRIFDSKEIDVQKETYKSFIENFKSQHKL